MGKSWLAAIAGAALLLAAAHADAADCGPFKGFTLALTPVPHGYFVPITIAGAPRQFLLQFDTAYSKLDEELAAALQLPVKKLPKGVHVLDAGGEYLQLATVPSVGVGQLTRKDFQLLTGPHREAWRSADGVAGLNMFAGFDLELDVGHNRLGLYLPRDCAFGPFWAADVVGEGKFSTEKTGSISLNMELDGKPVEVKLASSHDATFMPMVAAQRIFGIKIDDPLLTAVAGGVGRYRYPFKKLTGGTSVTVQNPDVLIYDNGEQAPCNGGKTASQTGKVVTCYGNADLVLGINVLKRLHLFFSFKDKNVYYTLAEPNSGISELRDAGK